MNEANNPYYQNPDEQQIKKPISAMSVISLILGILSLIIFFFLINYITGIIAVILAIIALVKKKGGKALCIAGIVTSAISFILSTLIVIAIYPLLVQLPSLTRDITRFYSSSNYQEMIDEFEKTGELPNYFDKYSEGESGEFFDEYYGGFDKFFDEYLNMEN